ncbi:MAG: hypothetical protein EHM14_04000 [Methanothrix sp.]|nr:MAG: hypothetical protein EHM14_04000 [Methanothrix sp.]
MFCRLALILIAVISAFILSTTASPNEASGIVTRVVDGDTFEVQGFGLVSLAGVTSPEMGTYAGSYARDFTDTHLLNTQVFLDIDESAAKRDDGSIPCLVYLSGSSGLPNLKKCFNEMIVDAGYAVANKT